MGKPAEVQSTPPAHGSTSPSWADKNSPANDAYVDITQHEIHALRTRHNLADAHTHQRQSPAQRDIVAKLPELWYDAEESLQEEKELGFIQAFFELHGQRTALEMNRTMLAYAASISTMAAGMYLAQRKMTVSLIEPCFDNLHDVLMHLGVKMSPLPEDIYSDVSTMYDRLAKTVQTDVVFLVDPNNPTGTTLMRHGRKGYEELVRYCKDHKKLLMLDLCFQSFALMDPKVGRFDLYELLEESGVSYITIEDTGKTWPVQDAKCALLTTSKDIHATVYNIHTSILLNVSPFVLSMLTQYLRLSQKDKWASIREPLSRNRATARKLLDGTILEYQEPFAEVSVAWFKIKKPGMTATQLQKILREQGVYVLPGTYFYWSDHSKGEPFIRIALAREPHLFEAAVAEMRRVLDSL